MPPLVVGALIAVAFILGIIAGAAAHALRRR
jgi:hypothetical protein